MIFYPNAPTKSTLKVSKTSSYQTKISVPNPETSNPKDVATFIANISSDTAKQVYDQLKEKGFQIPFDIEEMFKDAIDGKLFYFGNLYWRLNIKAYQYKTEHLSDYAYTFSFDLKGIQIPIRRKHLEECVFYERVILKPEPSNKYDNNAIKVMTENKLLGYVGRNETQEVKPLLTDYKAFIADISTIDAYIAATIIIYSNIKL